MKEQPAMVYGAIDLHMRYSQIRIVDETGVVLCDRRVVTSRERLTHVFAAHGPMRILLETGTESEWVAQALEAAGHDVVVADPNYAPMYGERTRRIKTDRRDVAALAEANRHGWYRATHRVSAAQRETRQILRSRRLLVQQRAATVSLIRSLLRQSGYRLPSGSCEAIPPRLARLTLPDAIADTLAPLSRHATALTAEIRAIEGRLRARVASDPVVTRLQTVPGVGMIVATTFRALIDTVDRFHHAGQVSATVGLVPREDSSAERHHRGHITKAGSSELRALCIQAAWACWRGAGGAPLRPWVDRLAARRGRRVAVVALARRLSRIMYAVWRDAAPFDRTKFATA
jgi:transposase